MNYYNLTKQQRKVLIILKELETSSFGKQQCETILLDGYYSESTRTYLNNIRNTFWNELKEKFDSTFIQPTKLEDCFSSVPNNSTPIINMGNNNTFSKNTFIGIDTAMDDSSQYTAYHNFDGTTVTNVNVVRTQDIQ